MNFIDIIPLFVETVSFKHTNYLLRCFGLTEKYDDLNFTKKEVYNTLECTRKAIKNLDKENILDRLNNDFLNVGITFLEYNNGYGSVVDSYPKEGIVAGEYKTSKEMIYICVNDTFFSNFINNQCELLANGIIAVSMHEDTHKQQTKRGGDKIKGLSTNTNIHTSQGFKRYLESFVEIDAHARETAIYLYNLGYSGTRIAQMFSHRDPMLENCSSYKKYWNYFGVVTTFKNAFDKDSLQRLKTWKKFLSRTISYLITTEKYKFTINTEEALKYLSDMETKIKAKGMHSNEK